MPGHQPRPAAAAAERDGHAPIFEPAALRALAFETAPDDAECRAAVALIRGLLVARQQEGTLAAARETRVEQSFNERLFAELFDYRTLFRDGQGDYHLHPKHHHPESGRKGRYDDFSLGFFSPSGGDPIVSAEFKCPGADLDAPQPAYGGKTAVEQAHDAARGATTVRWIVVSNFDEVRLYRVGDPERFERVVLSDVLAPADFVRAHALLSRGALLGERGRPGHLERLLKGGVPMLVPPRPDRVRLVHEVMALSEGGDALLSRVNDALIEGLAADPNWPRRLRDSTPELRDGRLVLRLEHEGELLSATEATAEGMLRVSEYIDFGPDCNLGPRHLGSDNLVQHVAAFIRLARALLPKTFGAKGGEFAWTLHEVGGARCVSPPTWTRGGLTCTLTAPADLTAWGYPPRRRMLDNTPAAYLADLTAAAVRELVFPFEHRDEKRAHVYRAKPGENEIQESVLGMFHTVDPRFPR